MMQSAVNANSRRSPIAGVIQSSSENIGGVLSHPTDLVKVGVKGRRLTQWSEQLGLELPARLYDVIRVRQRGVLARVGGEEIILECTADEPVLRKIEQSLLEPNAGVYRIEQQSATIELTGQRALGVLA